MKKIILFVTLLLSSHFSFCQERFAKYSELQNASAMTRRYADTLILHLLNNPQTINSTWTFNSAPQFSKGLSITGGELSMFVSGFGTGSWNAGGITMNATAHFGSDGMYNNAYIRTNGWLRLGNGDKFASDYWDIIQSDEAATRHNLNFYSQNIKTVTFQNDGRVKNNISGNYLVETGDLSGYQPAIAYTPANDASVVHTTGGTMTGDLQLPASPVNGTSAINKNYVDNLLTGLNWKQEVKAATTANINLSGTQTVDGIALNTGDRILVKNQTDGSQNGIYLVQSDVWSRASDADASDEIALAAVMVRQGSTNKNTQWTNSNDSYPTIGTDAITYAQIAGAGTYTNGTGLNLTGNMFSLNATYTNGLYPQLTGTYNNPTWIGSLAYGKLTGAPTSLSTFTNDPGYYKANDNPNFGTGSFSGLLTATSGLTAMAVTKIQSGNSLLIGADNSGSQNTVTNNTNKVGLITSVNYTTTANPFVVVSTQSQASNLNILDFGGGYSTYNTATLFRVWTSNNSTTASTGTLRQTIDGSGNIAFNTNHLYISGATGNVVMGSTTNAGYKLDVQGTFRTTGTATLLHLAGNSGTPTYTLGAGAGTGPTVTIAGDDIGGTITITTGTSPTAASKLLTITYNQAYSSAPNLILLGRAGATAPTDLYWNKATSSASSFDIYGTYAANTTYTLTYFVKQ